MTLVTVDGETFSSLTTSDGEEPALCSAKVIGVNSFSFRSGFVCDFI